MSATTEPGKSGNPIWWGLAIAIVALAAAAAWRLATDNDAFKFRAGADGFELITQAKADLSAATGELDELRRQIEAKDAALKKVATDLTEREGQIQKLLAQLDQASKSAAPSPAVQAANEQLARLRASAASSAVSAAPAVDWSKYKTATARIDKANSALAKIAATKK